MVSPVSCLFFVDHLDLRTISPLFTPLGLCVNNEDFHLVRCMGEEEGVDLQVVYGRGMALEAGHQADTYR